MEGLFCTWKYTSRLNSLRCRLLRRKPSPYSPSSQPFSACKLPTIEHYLWGNLPECLRFLRSASAAQLSTAQSTRTSSKASTRRSERDNVSKQASRQRWLEPACRRAFVQLAVFSKRTKKSKYARPTKTYNHCNHSQSRLAGVTSPVHCTLLYTALSLHPFYFVHACVVRVVFVDTEALSILYVATSPLRPFLMGDFFFSVTNRAFLLSS